MHQIRRNRSLSDHLEKPSPKNIKPEKPTVVAAGKGRPSWCLCPFPEAGRSPASLTVEAALCLPILLFSVYLLLMPMRMLNEMRRIQNRMEASAKTIAQAAYISGIGAELINNGSGREETIRGLTGGISTAAAQAAILSGLDDRIVEDASFSPETKILSAEEGDDENIIRMVLSYRMRQPFRLFSFGGTAFASVVNRRAWTGSEGGRGRSSYGGEEEGDTEEDPMVYIGKNSTRYHLDRDCHYLSNKLQAAPAGEMEVLRNSSGGKYHACPSCRPGSEGTVYYFQNGSAYHKDPECKAICAYIQEVRLSTVAHLGACSYCGS